jgi:lipopolysaccharide export system protein LptC
VAAAPGGNHDRLIQWLGKILTVAIALLAAIMALVPFSRHEEASLLLDRNKVAVTVERIAVSSAVYTGRDENGRPFSIGVERAQQRAGDVPVIAMTNLSARMQLSDGLAQVAAPAGEYDYDKGEIRIAGPVMVDAPNGYRLVSRNITVDLRERSLHASEGVQGALPAGSFSADAMSADLESRTITLDGHVRLRMTPGRLVLPN